MCCWLAHLVCALQDVSFKAMVMDLTVVECPTRIWGVRNICQTRSIWNWEWRIYEDILRNWKREKIDWVEPWLHLRLRMLPEHKRHFMCPVYMPLQIWKSTCTTISWLSWKCQSPKWALWGLMPSSLGTLQNLKGARVTCMLSGTPHALFRIAKWERANDYLCALDPRRLPQENRRIYSISCGK